MSSRIYQQVNLYQPIFRRQRQIFSAVTMTQSIAAVAVALMTIWAYGLWQVRGLEGEVLELEGREKAWSAQLARLDPAEGEQRRSDIERDVAELNRTLLAQQRLIEVLRAQPLGSVSGFSAEMRALSRRHSQGLWLTELRINGGTNAIELVGQSRDPGLIPQYLMRLSEEEALSGKRFDLFEIERVDNGNDLIFRVSSEAVAK